MRISDWSSDVCSSDLQHNREDAARAREVPTPERVTGIVGQRRKEDTLNGGMSAQAFHYLHRRCSLALKARCQRAEAALRKQAVVRGNAKAEVDRKSVG